MKEREGGWGKERGVGEKRRVGEKEGVGEREVGEEKKIERIGWGGDKKISINAVLSFKHDEMNTIVEISFGNRVNFLKGTHYGTKPGHFETSKIYFPTSEGVSEVSERANAAEGASEASSPEPANE